MPTLTWTGKDKVVNHHHDVPLRVLQQEYSYTAPEGTPANSTDNRIIHGDNLEALKSLLPEFEGKVNCIYIDPPYNTGNEGWVYNDAVNDPRIKKWLGQVVGKEGEDLTRHDKWLCMMYPRLKLLHRLLAKDGAILISIDENEYHYLKTVLDEIFGRNCYIGTIVWKTRNTDNRVKTNLSIDHEQVIIYSKRSDGAVNGRLIDRSNFKNQDDDPRGNYVTDPLTGKATAKDRPNLHYTIINPATKDKYFPDPARGWITDYQGFCNLLEDNKIWWPPNPKTGKPRKKRFLFETRERMPVSSFWFDLKGQTGSDELDTIMGKRLFTFPKSLDLMEKVIDIACNKSSLILDSFAGSGTTAHAILKLNAQDGGNRRFILCEMMDYAETITAERVRRVMAGYGEGNKATDGLGGAFSYHTIGEPLFLPDKNLNEAVGVQVIRDYVAYTENIPHEARTTPDNPVSPYLLGQTQEAAWLFHYEPDHVTALDIAFLESLQFGGNRPPLVVVYADTCLLSAEFLQRYGLIFKKIPRDITRL